jgi:hypothetical protein
MTKRVSSTLQTMKMSKRKGMRVIKRYRRKIRKQILFNKLNKLIPTTDELNEQKLKDKKKEMLLEKSQSTN